MICFNDILFRCIYCINTHSIFIQLFTFLSGGSKYMDREVDSANLADYKIFWMPKVKAFAGILLFKKVHIVMY